MFGLLKLYFKLLFLSVAKSGWLRWLLKISFIVVLIGLIPTLLRDADPIFPFGIAALDLAFITALCFLLSGFAVVVMLMIGIPLIRYGGDLVMLLGIGLFGYQVYRFVRFGDWQSFSLRDLTEVLLLTWNLDKPTGWVQLKEILASILAQTPLSLFLIVAGGIWILSTKKLLDNALQNLQGYERELLGTRIS